MLWLEYHFKNEFWMIQNKLFEVGFPVKEYLIAGENGTAECQHSIFGVFSSYKSMLKKIGLVFLSGIGFSLLCICRKRALFYIKMHTAKLFVSLANM
jgi:hypothetical protein